MGWEVMHGLTFEMGCTGSFGFCNCLTHNPQTWRLQHSSQLWPSWCLWPEMWNISARGSSSGSLLGLWSDERWSWDVHVEITSLGSGNRHRRRILGISHCLPKVFTCDLSRKADSGPDFSQSLKSTRQRWNAFYHTALKIFCYVLDPSTYIMLPHLVVQSEIQAIWNAETGRSQVQGLPRLLIETLFPK